MKEYGYAYQTASMEEYHGWPSTSFIWVWTAVKVQKKLKVLVRDRIMDRSVHDLMGGGDACKHFCSSGRNREGGRRTREAECPTNPKINLEQFCNIDSYHKYMPVGATGCLTFSFVRCTLYRSVRHFSHRCVSNDLSTVLYSSWGKRVWVSSNYCTSSGHLLTTS